MVKFYELYSEKEFAMLTDRLKLQNFEQSEFARIEQEMELGEIVQLPIAQLAEGKAKMQNVLGLIPFTSHIEIMNRCRTYEERIFYMLYAAQQHLKTEELKRCIINQTYATLLDKNKMMSPMLTNQYPNADFILKDKAVVDFLNLPSKHNEHHTLKSTTVS